MARGEVLGLMGLGKLTPQRPWWPVLVTEWSVNVKSRGSSAGVRSEKGSLGAERSSKKWARRVGNKISVGAEGLAKK